MDVTPALLLKGYASGIFPMAEHRDDPEVFWVDPRRRGVIPLDGFHASRSLRRAMRSDQLAVTHDREFETVVDACADRSDTWISDQIRGLYIELHETGHAHSLEVWNEARLIGGVYGVVLGAAFFGESMFSRQTNGSKIALACLVDRLNRGGFQLFDTQFLTAHLASLGAIEISRAQYHKKLAVALDASATFTAPEDLSPVQVAQRMTQTS